MSPPIKAKTQCETRDANEVTPKTTRDANGIKNQSSSSSGQNSERQSAKWVSGHNLSVSSFNEINVWLALYLEIGNKFTRRNKYKSN